MPTNQTSTAVLSDILKHYDPDVCVEQFNLVNPIAGAISDFQVLGQPVKASGNNMVFVEDGDEANATGIVITKEKRDFTSSETTTDKYAILMRGPCVIVDDHLPANDINGDAFTIATLVTAYKTALAPIRVAETSPKTDTQTT